MTQSDARCVSPASDAPACNIVMQMMWSCAASRTENHVKVAEEETDSDDKDKVTHLPSPSSCARGFLLISPGTTRPSSSWRPPTRSQTSLRGQRRVYSRPVDWEKAAHPPWCVQAPLFTPEGGGGETPHTATAHADGSRATLSGHQHTEWRLTWGWTDWAPAAPQRTQAAGRRTGAHQGKSSLLL